MRHHNLDRDLGYIPVAIDNIINRGTVKDWAEMLIAVKADLQVRTAISALRGVVYDRNDDEANWRLHGFWRQWPDGDGSAMNLVDWDHPQPETVYAFPDVPTIGPVEHHRAMRRKINTGSK